MPLFEVETDNHIIITWADDEPSATGVVQDAYPEEEVTRLTRRPRDTWVISKSALGLGRQSTGHQALYARNRCGPGTFTKSDRIQHGHGLVRNNHSWQSRNHKKRVTNILVRYSFEEVQKYFCTECLPWHSWTVH
jgi:hypothetical protein